MKYSHVLITKMMIRDRIFYTDKTQNHIYKNIGYCVVENILTQTECDSTIDKIGT